MEREKGNTKWKKKKKKKKRRAKGTAGWRGAISYYWRIVQCNSGKCAQAKHRWGGERRWKKEKKRPHNRKWRKMLPIWCGAGVSKNGSSRKNELYRGVHVSPFFSFSFDTPKKRHISHRGWALVLRRAINRYPRPRITAGLICIFIFLLSSFFLSCCARHTHKRHTRQ